MCFWVGSLKYLCTHVTADDPALSRSTAEDNELITLEIIHQFVETLDKYFGNVCELDLIFNFHKAYFILDELLLGGSSQSPQNGQFPAS